jgi:hypothetical protein
MQTGLRWLTGVCDAFYRRFSAPGANCCVSFAWLEWAWNEPALQTSFH